ncbi:MAG: lysozyme inhibitor LprI family protein [Planctomycetaceae bacterium]
MRLMTWSSTLIAILGLTIGLYAEESRRRQKSPPKPAASTKVDSPESSEPEDRIDKACRDCIDRDWTTAGMVRCAQVELLQREHELEEVHGKFLGMLDKRFGEDASRAFLKSHDRWEKYRDAEFKLINEMFRKIDGTMWLPIRVSEMSDIVHQRTKHLRVTMALLEEASLWEEEGD